jgi:hypothetical protein
MAGYDWLWIKIKDLGDQMIIKISIITIWLFNIAMENHHF